MFVQKYFFVSYRLLIHMKVFIRIIFVTELLKSHQPQQKRNYFLLNLFLLPVNSDKCDKNISPMKIIRYMVLLQDAKFSIFSILVINFGNFHNNIFLLQNCIKFNNFCEVCQTNPSFSKSCVCLQLLNIATC